MNGFDNRKYVQFEKFASTVIFYSSKRLKLFIYKPIIFDK